MEQYTVLVTRPKSDEEELTRELHEIGLRVIHEPLSEIILCHDARYQIMQMLAHEPDAIVLTSRHGANALALLTEMRDMFILCVGEATATTAVSLGFSRVAHAQGNVESLVNYISQAYDEGSRFAYLSADVIRADLAAMLPTMQIDRIVVYEVISASALSDTLCEQLRRGQISAVTFFSQRSAMTFLALLTKQNLRDASQNLVAFALSPHVAEPLNVLNWRGINVCSQPTLASMVECVDNAFHHTKERQG